MVMIHPILSSYSCKRWNLCPLWMCLFLQFIYLFTVIFFYFTSLLL